MAAWRSLGPHGVVLGHAKLAHPVPNGHYACTQRQTALSGRSLGDVAATLSCFIIRLAFAYFPCDSCVFVLRDVSIKVGCEAQLYSYWLCVNDYVSHYIFLFSFVSLN